MATLSDVRAAFYARLIGAGITSNGSVVPVRVANEDADHLGNVALPDTPSPFMFIHIETYPSRWPVGTGGGRGNNVYRTEGTAEIFVMVPKGTGLSEADRIAEAVAATFRSYRDATMSCFGATPRPGTNGTDLSIPGTDSPVGNYFVSAASVSFWYDQIG